MFKHDRDQRANRVGDRLVGECVRPFMAEGRGDKGHRVEMSMEHFLRVSHYGSLWLGLIGGSTTHVVFLACEIPEVLAFHTHNLPITLDRCFQEAEPPVHEFLGVLARSSKVDELDLVILLVVQEICPIRVGLHESEVEELLQAQTEDVGSNLSLAPPS